MKIEDVGLKNKLAEYGTLTRLIGKVKFKTHKGWSKTYDALIDTGAHTTLIPLSIWQDIETDILSDHEVKGILAKKEYSVPVKVAKVKTVMFDLEGNQTDELEIPAYMSLIENVLLLIGFRNVLDKFRVCFDYQQHTAFIEKHINSELK
ncbi:MAG: hypothetical protein CVT89_04605 [Candidatus Altiarchaeales archaeon HGW-Altiarchaeales-2]|nr:MAG: hypothetical protein CVT89_04605 [Candidatus Altiarchaeales archaeon HGW-Altiarchaeales-2]